MANHIKNPIESNQEIITVRLKCVVLARIYTGAYGLRRCQPQIAHQIEGIPIFADNARSIHIWAVGL